MASLNQVINGLKKYLDSELISKVSGINKWIVGAGLSMALDNGASIFNELKGNNFVERMEIINKDDEIDVPKLYKYLSNEAKKSAVTFSMPFIGTITLKQSDIEKIYNYIQES